MVSVEYSKIEDCRKILKETKTDLKKMKEKFGPKNEIEDIKIMARSFFKNNVQTLMESENDEIFKFDRQLEELFRAHKIIERSLEKASEEICRNEKNFGVGLNHNNWEEVKNRAKYNFRKQKKV